MIITLKLRDFIQLLPRLWPKLASIHLLKVDNRNTRTRFEICSKLTIETPERRHWCCFGVFIVNFELVTPCSSVFIVNFEHVNAEWEGTDMGNA